MLASSPSSTSSMSPLVVPRMERLHSTGLLKRRRRLGAYVLGKTIGEGTFGRVMAATVGQKSVAIKGLGRDEHRLQEPRLQSMCHAHPNILSVLDVVQANEDTFLVLEMAEVDLFDFVIKHGPLPDRQFRPLMRQLVAAVAHVHSLGVAHCDIKPENILLTNEGCTALVADFGKALECRQGEVVRTSPPGTVRCLPPELFTPSESDVEKGDNKRSYDPMALDVWALGVTAFFMVSGYFPFDGADANETAVNIVSGRFTASVPNSVSSSTVKFITKMLQLSPQHRPTAQQLAELLAPCPATSNGSSKTA